MRRVEKIQINCIICGSPFLVYPSIVGHKKCCSQSCTRKLHAQNTSKRKGVLNPNWKGGRFKNTFGYWVRRFSSLSPEELKLALPMKHPTREEVLEHRLVMAKKLGRSLKSSEIVHHINGDRGDNRFDNLQLFSRRKHLFEDIMKKRQMRCPRCGYAWHY